MAFQREEIHDIHQYLEATSEPTQLLSHFVVLEEDTALDAETTHRGEVVQALALGRHLFAQQASSNEADPTSLRRDAPEFGGAMEIGLVRGLEGDGWTTSGLRIPLAKEYETPIVVVEYTRDADGDEGVLRLDGVSPRGFYLRFQPYNEYAGETASQKDIFYMVVDTGVQQAAGLTVEAGKDYTAYHVADDQWLPVSYRGAFTAPPKTYATLNTTRCSELLWAIKRNETADGMELTQAGGIATYEYCFLQVDPEAGWNDIGWMALERGEGVTVDGRTLRVTDQGVEVVYEDEPPRAPDARFEWSPRSAAAGTLVQFTDTSSGLPSSWSWSFGDGTSSNQPSPTHAYDEPGFYQVNLAVSNAIGVDMTSRVIEVTEPSDVIMSDDFESGGLSAWSSASPP
jgi:hypothetical protein